MPTEEKKRKETNHKEKHKKQKQNEQKREAESAAQQWRRCWKSGDSIINPTQFYF